MTSFDKFILSISSDNFLSLGINEYSLACFIWNIFLVIVAVGLTMYITYYYRRTLVKKSYEKIILVVLGFLWLVFIPNTAYLITDIRHLLDYCPNNKHQVCIENAWMIPVFFAYGLLGWATFIILARNIKNLILKIYNRTVSRIFEAIVVALVSTGVMLGLINRWNSWEIFVHPYSIIRDSIGYFTDKIFFLNWAVYTFSFYVFYYIGARLLKDRDL